MARNKEFTIDIWEKTGTRTINADSTVNSPTYAMTFGSVPCRIVPLATGELFQSGVLDWGNANARLYIDLDQITELTHNALVVVHSTGAVWRVINEPEQHLFGLKQWETVISNVSVAAEGVAYYGG